jgi:hypothetical protein
MTPKEKAKEIYCNYTDTLNIRDLQTTANPFAKKCALIVVDEIIYEKRNFYPYGDTSYWKEVKKELEKI